VIQFNPISQFTSSWRTPWSSEQSIYMSLSKQSVRCYFSSLRVIFFANLSLFHWTILSEENTLRNYNAPSLSNSLFSYILSVPLCTQDLTSGHNSAPCTGRYTSASCILSHGSQCVISGGHRGTESFLRVLRVLLPVVILPMLHTHISLLLRCATSPTGQQVITALVLIRTLAFCPALDWTQRKHGVFT
jgi:hypothetical protein